MSIYELQDRLAKAGKTTVKAYACHPGSSRTSLIDTSGSFMMRFIFNLMKLSPMTQSAEKGSYPALMCATEEDLDQKGFWGGRFIFDGAHQAGLIAGGQFQDPLAEGATVLTGSAGKTFSGPQSG